MTSERAETSSGSGALSSRKSTVEGRLVDEEGTLGNSTEIAYNNGSTMLCEKESLDE